MGKTKKVTIKRIDNALHDARFVINITDERVAPDAIKSQKNIVNILWDMRDEVKKHNKDNRLHMKIIKDLGKHL